MKKATWFICLFVGMKVFSAPFSTVEVKVVDEAGAPIEGVVATIVFNKEGDRKKYEGRTGTDGLFSAQGEIPAKVGLGGKKEGYYRSIENFYFLPDRNAPNPISLIEKRTLTLRKIIDPKEGKKSGVGGGIPKLNEPLGMDLLVGDWVVPYGKGVVSDFIVTCSNDTTNKVASYILTFPNPGDGIVEYPRNTKGQSIFWWSHKAPLDGYLNKMMKKQSYAGGIPVSMPGYEELLRESLDVQCIFRIRTEYDAQGKIISAYYGKIKGVPGITWNNLFGFGYWLNTDPHSRSLESTHPTSP